VAIVTGASAGIVAAIAHRLVTEGARVVGVGRRAELGTLVAAPGDSQRARFVAGSVAIWARSARPWTRRTIGKDPTSSSTMPASTTRGRCSTPLSTKYVRCSRGTFFGALLMLQAAGRAMVDRGGGSTAA
jgi:NAD(P)-dependent dehydrogenase (short-subunit alcohol dehydrogenase family)